MTCGIYQIKNLINNKIYIGSTIHFKVRWNEHTNALKQNRHHSILLQRAWNKYGGEAFEFSIIEIVKDKDDLYKIEQLWLDATKCYYPEMGYNICSIAKCAVVLPVLIETRRKQSIAQTGRKHPDEVKAKISKSHTGKIVCEKVRFIFKEANEKRKALGITTNRRKEKWPCEDGCYCKCKTCMKIKSKIAK